VAFRSSRPAVLPGAAMAAVGADSLRSRAVAAASMAVVVEATAAVVSGANPRRWLCLLLGHKWRRSVNDGAEFQRCLRCGKERETPAVVQYPGGGP
jgi:hypothetical protein